MHDRRGTLEASFFFNLAFRLRCIILHACEECKRSWVQVRAWGTAGIGRRLDNRDC